MSSLALSFPTLERADGVYPWDARKFDRWVRTSPAVTAGSHWAGRFVLCVWDPGRKWKTGPFNVVRAFQCWDDPHRRAFIAWTQKPFWP